MKCATRPTSIPKPLFNQVCAKIVELTPEEKELSLFCEARGEKSDMPHSPSIAWLPIFENSTHFNLGFNLRTMAPNA